VVYVLAVVVVVEEEEVMVVVVVVESVSCDRGIRLFGRGNV
jgi:hypothetical protein